MTLPVTGSDAIGLRIERPPAFYYQAGTSPQAGTFAIPDYGMWDSVICVGFQNTNNVGILRANHTYYNGVSNIKNLKSTIVGDASFSANSDMNSLTISDPDANGLVTVTAGWATTATSRTIWLRVLLRQIADNAMADPV